jgi:hypothetical protein
MGMKLKPPNLNRNFIENPLADSGSNKKPQKNLFKHPQAGGTCSPVPGGRLDESRSWQETSDPSFTRAPMLTGAPSKARPGGRSAQLASELMVKGQVDR